MNVIKIENLWKEYLLGVIGHGTLTHDLQSWWARMRGKEDPNSKIASLPKGYEKQTEGNRFWALRDINLDIEHGEVLGIIGKNGAGKSTLLKVLSRVTAPTNGSIKIKGRIASLLEVGTGFHQELTGRENVFLNGAILGMSKQEVKKKFDEIVDFSGVGQYLETPVKRYSSGMRVRLAFAVAAHLDPEILVVDEVLAVGDAEFQKKCLGKMDDIRGEGKTILFVSHHMPSIENLCTRAVILKNGEVWDQGKVRTMIDLYLKDIYQGGDEKGAVFSRMAIPKEKKIWINKIEMMVGGVQTNRIRSGQNVELAFGYDAISTGLNCQLHLGIYNHLDEKIIHVGTLYNNMGFRVNEKGSIKCIFPEIALPEGQYHINFSLHLDGQPYDRVQRAISFYVEQGDFYGSGKLPSNAETKFLAKCSWIVA